LKQKLKKALKISLPIFLGVGLLLYLFNSYSEEQRVIIYKNIKNADYSWVWISILLGSLSHLSRAYRWKYLLEPLNCKSSFQNRAMAVFVAYFSNLGIPRSGEILRATTLASYENITFEKAFGTIIAERIADLIMTMIIISLALFVQYETIINLIKTKIPSNPIQIFVIGILSLLLFIFLFKKIQKSNHKIIVKIRSFILGLKDGVTSILNMKHKWAFIFHTVFIWTMYVLMFYVIFFSIEETKNPSLAAVLTSFVTGSFAVATTNGGFLAYPIAIEETLSLFGFASEPSQAVGWIMWSAQTILTIVLGAISFFYLPIYNRRK